MSLLWVKFNKLAFRGFSKIGFRYCSQVCQAFTEESIVPDVVGVAPKELVEVCYQSGVIADLGNKLTPTKVKDQPELKWPADKGCLYTLCLVDPDYPCREAPEMAEFQHWLVGNIPECNLCEGQVLTEYVPSIPLEGTCFHRYVFLVYQQLGKLCYDDVSFITATSAEGREQFSIQNFACKYRLGEPYAGNFYQAEYDCYVKKILKQMCMNLDE